MKKLFVLSLLSLSAFSLIGCNSDQVKYSYNDFIHLLLERSPEPAPYTEATIVFKETGKQDQTFMYENTAEQKLDDVINDVYDDSFALMYLGEDEIKKCNFYAGKYDYHISGKKVNSSMIYDGVDYSMMTFDYQYDFYGMPTVKSRTLFERNSSRKIKITETYSYK